MTVLAGGMRALNANGGQSADGVFTARPGTLSNDIFVNLLDNVHEVEQVFHVGRYYEGVDRSTGRLKWTATPVDLMLGSSSELRSAAEVYSADDGKEAFVQDFVKAWDKVMNLDRFDLH